MDEINTSNLPQSGGRRTMKPRFPVGGIIGIVVAAVIVGTMLVCCILASGSSSFFPNTYVGGVNISRTTPTEALGLIRQELLTKNCSVYVNSDEEPLAVIPYADLLQEEPTDAESLMTLYANQHGSNFFSGGWNYLKSLFASSRSGQLPLCWDDDGIALWIDRLEELGTYPPQDTTPVFEGETLAVTMAKDGRTMDVDALRSALISDNSLPNTITAEAAVVPAKTMTAQEIYDTYAGEMKNAAYDADTDTILEEQVGVIFNVEEAQKLMGGTQSGETVKIPATVNRPSVTKADLEKVLFRDILGEAKTHVSGTAARISNVKLAAGAINGVVLNSGETFSYNGTVGQRTEAKGYLPAPAYVKGETVDEIGGGVCQPSSTLYLACLTANLKITERSAHRYAPAYIAWGMDATVSWGGPDYKFTNDTEYPVKIVTRYDGGYLTVQLLGTNVTGNYAKVTNAVTSTTPWETVYEQDNTLPAGTETVKVTPYTGYEVDTYHTIYDAKGNVIDSHFEAHSSYKVRNKIILQGPAVSPIPGDPTVPGVIPVEPPIDEPPFVPIDPIPIEPENPGTPDTPVDPELPVDPETEF